MSTFGGFVLIGLAVFFYFIPTFIAMMRDAAHRGSIALINLLFGWTVLGWIAALIWAIVEKPVELKPVVTIDNYEPIWQKKQREKAAAAESPFKRPQRDDDWKVD
jgi:Superinfection immunity protein